MSNLIEFNLFAPYNKEVNLIGSFSDWQEIPMERGKDGYFRAQVELKDGTYQYKYRVRSKSFFLEADAWVDVIDPYSTNIDESAQNSVVWIKDGQRIVDTYVWQHDDKPLPGNEELIIYELLVKDFSGGEDDPHPRGKFKHVIEKLDYLQDLGINAIELMPVQEFPGEQGWGYNTCHYFAVESSYGSTSDLKHLIDECHGRGMRVILDAIYNHSDADSPLTQIDYDYWYRRDPKDPDFNWGPEFDYDHYDENLGIYPAREYVGAAVRYWISEFHIDGIRYDAVKQIDNHDFLHWLTEQARQTADFKPFYNIAEQVPDTPAITNVDGPMDACWHDGFWHTVVPQICGDEFNMDALKDVLDAKRKGYMGTVNVINYIANHDHNHLMAELSDREIFDDAAFKRAKLGSALLMTTMGVPLIWMGEEFGAYQHKTLEPAKIEWNLLANDRNRGLFEHYRGLINLRQQNRALFTSNMEFFHENPDCQVLAYVRWNDEGSRVAVVANFSDNFLADYQVTNFPQDGNWHEWANDYDVEARDGCLITDLPEYEAKVFVWHP